MVPETMAGSAQQQQTNAAGPQAPMLFTVIIPTYNRPGQLTACLLALAKQSLASELWEVIVVDDGSEQELLPRLRQLTLPFAWHCHRQQNQGPATARNAGAERARGRYLVFIDDDCEPDQRYLEVLAATIRPQTLVGGKVINGLKDNIYAEASQLLLDVLLPMLATTHLMFFTSNNFALCRESFQQAGGFSTEFRGAAGEDREFCIRYRHLGHSLLFCPAAIVNHAHKLTLNTFIRQHYHYGRANTIFRRTMRQQGITLKQRNKMFFFQLLINFFSSAGKRQLPAGLQLAALLTLSQLAYAGGYLWQFLKDFCTGEKQGATPPHP